MFLLNYSTVIDPLLQDVRAYTAGLLSSKPLYSVIDVCCGTGDQIVHYAQKGLIATGVDQDNNMISQALKKRDKHGFNSVDFYIAYATKLPFRDGHFDSASICLGLHEMNEVKQDMAVSEMKRVVKKGGTLVFIDFRVPFPINPWALLIRTVEFMAGKYNNQCFRKYLAKGGLETILRRNHLSLQKQSVVKLGLMQIIETNNYWLIA